MSRPKVDAWLRGSHSLAMAIAMLIGPFATGSRAQAQKPKQPVPERRAQEAALDEIRELFRAEYQALNRNTATALANQLIKTARESKDTVARYVLYREAMRIAVDAGQPQAAWAAVQGVLKQYDVQPEPVLEWLMTQTPRNIESPAGWQQLFEIGQPVIQNLVDRDSYDLAESIARKLSSRARKQRADSWQQVYRQMTKTIRDAAEEYAKIEPALRRLEKNPDDATAHEKVGKYYCFVKRDFEQGLAHLAKSSNIALRGLAIREAQLDADAADARVALADDWAEWGQSHEVRPAIAHAIELYRAGLDSLSGLVKKRVQKRLSELNQSPNDVILVQVITEYQWQIRWKSKRVWTLIFAPDGNVVIVQNGRKFSNSYVLDNDVAIIISKDGQFSHRIRFVGLTVEAEKLATKTQKIIDRGSGFAIKR